MIPKFRIFNKRRNEMDNVYLIDWQWPEQNAWVNDEPFDENYVFMRSTGLTDIHGVEIFEGDVLEVRSELYTNFGTKATGEYSTEIKQVIWMLDSWGTKRLGSDYESKQLSITSKYGTVIGNIHEHPELLEVIT